MGMFIEIKINPVTCEVSSGCDVCVRLCPAEIFQANSEQVTTIFDNEDECTLCDLCVEQCPGKSIQVGKLY
jgi:NAD-dependent dihydropyrimidine dehydrogenase PreA subunit